jgi:hypothetical protein
VTLRLQKAAKERKRVFLEDYLADLLSLNQPKLQVKLLAKVKLLVQVKLLVKDLRILKLTTGISHNLI